MTLPTAEFTIPFLLALGDDELVLGHRDSEWCAFAPMIEEDVAFASIAQDEMGHARLYYRLAETQGAPSPDALAFERPPAQFRSAKLLEHPNGDWAFTVARHLTYDLYDDLITAALSQSSWTELADIARLVRREERYHLEHQRLWVGHLAGGGDEARTRLEAAFALVIAEVGGLTEKAPWHDACLEAGLLRAPMDQIRSELAVRLNEMAESYRLTLPPLTTSAGLGGREGTHTQDLASALAALQEVWRADTKATW